MKAGSAGSDYMLWAKTRSAARFNLATSGVANYSLADLPVTLEDLELSGPSLYGYEPLQRSLAARLDVAPESVVAATGTSMANHLAMAAVIEPGDEVLIEHPAYDPLLATARYLGAEVQRVARRFEDGFRIRLDDISRQITSRTRLIIITNLHNPTGALTSDADLGLIGQMARGVGARVLVDEVYLDAMFDESPRSSVHLGEEFIATSSLTKVYGLSGLRCGWVLAPPDLAQRMWRLNDLFGVIPAHPAERLSVIALANIDRIARRARALLDRNRTTLNEFLASRPDLETVRPQFGTVAFPRWAGGDVDGLCERLRHKYETAVVPGRFFEMADHFRIGLGGDPQMFEAGLERLGAALDDAA